MIKMQLRAELVLLLVILGFNVWLRGHTFGPTIVERYHVNFWPITDVESEPLDCDEAVYAYIGKRIVAGDVMYRDLTENKPPGGYWLYALAVAIGGANELTIRLMPVPIVSITILLIWWIGRVVAGPGAGLLAALVYAIASTDPFIYGNGANFEHAINLAAVASLACLVRRVNEPGRAALLWGGFFVGCASLIKQVAVVHLFAYVLLLALMPRKSPSLRAWGGDCLALAIGAAVPWIIAISILTSQGAADAAFNDFIRYGGALATDTPPDRGAPPGWMRWITGNAAPDGKLPSPFGNTDYLVWWGSGTWPLWAVALPGLLVLLAGDREERRGRTWIAVWTIAALIQVVLPGLYWPHYYLLPLPGVALVTACLLSEVLILTASSRNRNETSQAISAGIIALGIVLAILGVVTSMTRNYVLVKPQDLTTRFKGGRQWVALRDLGHEIGERSASWRDPRIFVWGWQSPLYLYSGLNGVSRQVFVDPLMKAFAHRYHPQTQPRTQRIMEDLRRRPPDIVFAGDPPFLELLSFLQRMYRRSLLLPPMPNGVGLWVLNDKVVEFEAAGKAKRLEITTGETPVAKDAAKPTAPALTPSPPPPTTESASPTPDSTPTATSSPAPSPTTSPSPARSTTPKPSTSPTAARAPATSPTPARAPAPSSTPARAPAPSSTPARAPAPSPTPARAPSPTPATSRSATPTTSPSRGKREGASVRNPDVAVTKGSHDGVPGLALGVLSGGAGVTLQTLWMVDQFNQPCGEDLGWIGRFDQYSRAAGLDDIGHSASGHGDHRQPRRHRLQDNVAEGLGQAGEREQIARGVVVGQRFSGPEPDEPSVSPEALLERWPGWTVAHDHHPGLRPRAEHDLQRRAQVLHVLLGGDPADVADHYVGGGEAQALANRLAARPIGPEPVAVHPARPEHQALESPRLQPPDRRWRGHVGLDGRIVEPSHVTPDQASRPANLIMRGVLIEVGMEARDHRQVLPQAEQQSAQAQRHLGGDVDDVRVEPLDRAMDLAKRWTRQANVRVKWHGHRRNHHRVHVM